MITDRAFPNRFRRRAGRIMTGLILSALMVFFLSSCGFQRFSQINTYEEFAEIANTFRASLYFKFNDVDIPGFETLVYKDAVWRKKNSPVVIEKSMYILPGVTIRIEPGVTVMMGKDANIVCRGVFQARGTAEEPIIFTWKDEGEYWNAIEFNSSIRKGEEGAGVIEFEHCVVEYGQGMVINSSEARVENCVFRNNIATPLRFEYAGGLIANNRFYGNSNQRQTEIGNGGGLNVYSDRSVRVEANEVYDNVAHGGRDGGGGIYAFAYNRGDIQVIRNTVRNNTSDRNAGGIYAYEARVIGNRVLNNRTEQSGGGIFAVRSVVEKNLVSGNTAVNGGGIYSEAGTIDNNMVSGNQSTNGSGLYHLGEGVITRNTLMENVSPQQPTEGSVVVLSGNPMIERNNIIASEGYALKFLSHSQSPDLKAHNNYWGTMDKAVIQGLVYDWLKDSEKGLVQWQPYLLLGAINDYPVPENLPEQVDKAVPGDVADRIRGLIESDIEIGGNGKRIFVDGNLLIQEGSRLTIRPGTELYLEEGVTIRVRGQLMAVGEKDRRIRFTGDRDKTWGHLFFESRSLDEQDQALSEKSLLKYSLIEHGSGISMDGLGADLFNCTVRANRGTGIRIKEVGVSIMNSRIIDNVSAVDGGGLYIYSSQDVFIHGNDIRGNRAADGGGIFSYGYQSNVAVDIRDNHIQDNFSHGDGGGIWISRSALVNNTITGNRTEARGGGVYTSFALIHDNRIEGNTAESGGGIYAEANSSLKKNIIKANFSRKSGGGVYINYWGISMHNKEFLNNVVEGNRASDPGETGGVVVKGELEYFANNTIRKNTGAQLYESESISEW